MLSGSWAAPPSADAILIPGVTPVMTLAGPPPRGLGISDITFCIPIGRSDVSGIPRTLCAPLVTGGSRRHEGDSEYAGLEVGHFLRQFLRPLAEIRPGPVLSTEGCGY